MAVSRRNTSKTDPAETFTQVRALMDAGMMQAARDMALRLIGRQSPAVKPLLLLATIEEHLGRLGEALRCLQQCLRLAPDNLTVVSGLARVLHRMGRSEEAIEACHRGLTLSPGNASFIVKKATVQDQCNDYAGAWDTLQPLLSERQIAPEAANLAARALYGLGRFEEAIQSARTAAQDPLTPDDSRRTLWLHVVKVCDKIGRYDEAMAACQAAHQTVHRNFDSQGFVRYVDSLLSTYDAANLRLLARSGNPSALPVFIIGMPRSGTSLVEQIVAAHPLTFAAGEINDIVDAARSVTAETGSLHVYPDSVVDLTPETAGRLAERYLRRLHQLGGDAQRVTNKMLEQYEHVGLIWQLLPGARIVHCQRDPLDTCLSCYTRHLNPNRMPYVTNLEHLGLVYRQHERLMEHWKKTLDLQFFTVQYEELVANQERVSRQLIDFLGLPWDDRCLRYWEADRTVMTLSYDQVNKPIFDSSIGRWRNYEKHLGPLKRALGLDGE